MSTAIALGVSGLPGEAELLAAAASAGLDVRRRCVDAADLLGACLSAPGLTAVVTARLPRLSAEVIARLHACDCRVIGIALHADDLDRLEALGIEARIQAGDDPRELPAMVAQALSEGVGATGVWNLGTPSAPTESREARGRLIAVWGPPGAPGRTTTAVLIARALADRAPTAIVDLDVAGPSLALNLGLAEDLSGVILACRHAESGSLTGRTLQSSMSALPPRLLALTGIPHPRRWPEIRPAALERVLECVRHEVGYGVIDIGSCLSTGATTWPSITDAADTALAAADIVVAACRAEPLGVARFLADLPELAERQLPIVSVLTGGSVREESRALLEEGAHRLGITMPVIDLALDPTSVDTAVRRGAPLRARGRLRRGARSSARLLDLVA